MNGSTGGEPPVLTLDLFDTAPVGVSVWQGPQHVLVYMNAVWRQIFGDRPLWVPARDAFADMRQDEYFSLVDRVYETGEPLYLPQAPIQARYSHGEVEERYFGLSVSPVSTGEHRGVLLLAVEVTGQVTASEQLRMISERRRRALNRYESLVAASAETVWVTDPHGRVLERSPAWERMTGMSWQEMRGSGWLKAVHPDDREELQRAWQQALQEVPELFQRTYRLRHRDGSYRHTDLRAAPVRENGMVVEWVAASVDIEDRWQYDRRMELLARASTAVTESSRAEDAFAGLTRVMVPDLCDKSGIYLLPESVEPTDERPIVANRIAVAARDGLPTNLPPLREERIQPGSAFERAVRQRRPIMANFTPGEVPEGLVPPGTESWLAAARAHSMVLVPILVDGVVVAMADAFVCGDRQPVGSNEMRLVRELLEQAHDPLSNVLRFRRTRRVALALQHSLLTAPPRIPDLEIVARYMSSPAADEVGGDWYDCFVLPDGESVMVIIGDIAGHDVDAAVTMSQLRNMLRSLAVDRDEPPGDVLRRLDQCAQLLGPEEATATCVLARLQKADGTTRRLEYSAAGHLPPLLITDDGGTRYLEEGHTPILGGLDSSLPRESAQELLRPGTTLLLYTDGLVERRDEDLDASLRRLREHASDLAGRPLDTFCNQLIDRTVVSSATDDIALIALRLPNG